MVKLETLTSCLRELFLQHELSAGLGIRETGQKRQEQSLSHFQLRVNFSLSVNLTCTLRQYLLLAYKLTSQRRRHCKHPAVRVLQDYCFVKKLCPGQGPLMSYNHWRILQGIHKLPACGSSGHVWRLHILGARLIHLKQLIHRQLLLRVNRSITLDTL